MIRLLLVISMILIGSAQAQSLRDTVPNVSVVGEAFEDVAPDRATLRFGVVTERPTAAAAASENAALMSAILAELGAMGIPAADMRTEVVTLAPVNSEERDAKGKPKPAPSFRASNILTVFVKPAEKAGDVVGRAIDKGANSVEGVDYDNTDLDVKRDGLRARAVKDAERRARVYAEAAGLRLGRVIEIRPLSDEAPRFFEARIAAAPAPAAAKSVPLQPGVQRVSERVSVIWALGR